MNETDPRTFNILPVARTGNRLRNHPSKYYLYSRVEETTNWLITVYEVRDIDGILQITDTNIEKTCFSVGCQITDRIMIDTGSMLVPNLEYNIASNEIQLFNTIKIVMIYQLYNELINPRIILNNSQFYYNLNYNLSLGSTYGTFKKSNIFSSVEKSPAIYFPFLRKPCSLNVYPCSFAIFRIFLLKFSPLPKYNV